MVCYPARFSTSLDLMSARSFAHNGKLAFRLGHSEYMSNGKDMIKDWDVILESKEWRLRVGVKNLIPPWVGATNNELSLNEKSWTVIKGPGHGHSPTEIQMLRLLSSLSAIYFRGGYYDGHEETWIDSIVLKEGDHHVERMQRKVRLIATHSRSFFRFVYCRDKLEQHFLDPTLRAIR